MLNFSAVRVILSLLRHYCSAKGTVMSPTLGTHVRPNVVGYRDGEHREQVGGLVEKNFFIVFLCFLFSLGGVLGHEWTT